MSGRRKHVALREVLELVQQSGSDNEGGEEDVQVHRKESELDLFEDFVDSSDEEDAQSNEGAVHMVSNTVLSDSDSDTLGVETPTPSVELEMNDSGSDGGDTVDYEYNNEDAEDPEYHMDTDVDEDGVKSNPRSPTYTAQASRVRPISGRSVKEEKKVMNMFKKPKAHRNSQLPAAVTKDIEDSLMSGGSSTENLAKEDRILHQRVHFKLFYVGCLLDVSGLNSKRRDTEAQLVDYVEEKQIEGKIKTTVTEEDKVTINVSRYGFKVLDTSGQEVIQRHPLHTISQLIHYTDGANKPNIILKTGQVGKPTFHCYIFQCHTEDQAQAVCQCVRRIFDAITAKS